MTRLDRAAPGIAIGVMAAVILGAGALALVSGDPSPVPTTTTAAPVPTTAPLAYRPPCPGGQVMVHTPEPVPCYPATGQSVNVYGNGLTMEECRDWRGRFQRMSNTGSFLDWQTCWNVDPSIYDARR